MKLLKHKEKGIPLMILILLMMVLMLLSSCDKISKCRPKINLKTGYVGFYCEGEF